MSFLYRINDEGKTCWCPARVLDRSDLAADGTTEGIAGGIAACIGTAAPLR